MSVIALLCLSDFVIAGAKYNGITFTCIPGEFYWGFKLLVIASFSFSITLMAYCNFKHIRDFISKTKLSNILLCYAGLAAFSIVILFIMPHFERINAVGVLPILMGIFLFGLAHSVSREDLIDLTYWLPFSKRRRLINQLVKPLITACEDGIAIDTKKEYDNIVRQHALELFKGDEAKAKHWLQSYRPPLYSD